MSISLYTPAWLTRYFGTDTTQKETNMNEMKRNVNQNTDSWAEIYVIEKCNAIASIPCQFDVITTQGYNCTNTM